MATQRPSADVFPQGVKANMGIKLAFRVSTQGNSKILLENNRALLLPNKQGRCILDLDEQREMQVPYLSREVHEKILKQYKGDEQNAFNGDSLQDNRGSNRIEGNRESTGDYRLE